MVWGATRWGGGCGELLGGTGGVGYKIERLRTTMG